MSIKHIIHITYHFLQVQEQTFQTLQTKIHLRSVGSKKKTVGLSWTTFKESILTLSNYSMATSEKNSMQFIMFCGHLEAMPSMEICQKGKPLPFESKFSLDSIIFIYLNYSIMGCQVFRKGYKTRQIFGKKSTYSKNTRQLEMNYYA